MCITFSTSEHTARKHGRCSWCGEWIEIGERYVSQAGIGRNGDFFHSRFHLECDADCLLVAREEGGFIEFMPGDSPRPYIANYVI